MAAMTNSPDARSRDTRPKAGPRPEPGEDDEHGPETPQIRALRIAVIVMSLLLVVGFITVIARIIYLASRSNAPATAAVQAAPAAPASLKPEVGVALPPGASLGSTHLDGARLTLGYTAPSGNGVVILDMETGKVLSRVRVTAEGR